MDLTTPTAAVVTGAASGLGRATAVALAEAGLKVAVLDIDENGGRKVAADIGGVFCHADITDEDSVVAAFAAAKAGVKGLAMPLAVELKDLGIRVNAVVPGIFDTPAVAGLRDDAPEAYDAMVGAVGFPRRAGHAEEFAGFVLELVRNNYLNGQAFRIDGAVRLAARP